MATDASIEDQNCIVVHSIGTGFKLPEASFRSDLMESAVPEEQAAGESNMTDSDKSSKKNRRRESYEAELQDKDKEITRLTQLLESKMTVTESREARGVKEETDFDDNEEDEEEQYRHLYAAEVSDSVNPANMESVSQPVASQSSAPSHAILQKRLSETQDQLQKKLNNESKLQKRLSETEQELDRHRRNSSSLERQLSETQEELEGKRRENEILREEAKTIKRSSSARSRSALDEKLHIKLNQEIGKGKELEKKLQLEQEQVKTYKKQVDEMHHQLSKMQCDKAAKTEEQIQQYKKEKAEFEERMQRLQDNLETKSQDLAEEAKKCQTYQDDLEKKKREIENQREQFTRERGELVREKEELEQETVRQTHQLRDLEKSLSVEKQERTKIHSQVQLLREENRNLQQEKDKVEKEAQDVCTKFQKEAELTLLTYDQLKEKSDKDSEILLDQRQKINGYTKRIENLRAENSELETVNKKMANDVQRLTAEKQKLESNIKTVQDGMLAVKLTADENESAFHVEREARTKDKANYEGKIRQLKMEIEDLNTKLQNMQSKNDALARDKKHLMEQLNAFAATQCHDTFTS